VCNTAQYCFQDKPMVGEALHRAGNDVADVALKKHDPLGRVYFFEVNCWILGMCAFGLIMENSNGRVKPDWVAVDGEQERHPEARVLHRMAG
jgi:hypothetical protein